MCKMCENKIKSQVITITNGYNTYLDVGIDENLRLYFKAIGDDETDKYYPKYCPECGRKLNKED